MKEKSEQTSERINRAASAMLLDSKKQQEKAIGILERAERARSVGLEAIEKADKKLTKANRLVWASAVICFSFAVYLELSGWGCL